MIPLIFGFSIFFWHSPSQAGIIRIEKQMNISDTVLCPSIYVFPSPSERGGYNLLYVTGLTAECNSCKTNIKYIIKSYKITVLQKEGDTIVYKNNGQFFEACFLKYLQGNFQRVKEISFSDFIIYVRGKKIDCILKKTVN
jgi:hypothetical protein